ncbi:MAG: tetratricopeptide repeat protein [Proteobacteria bacterium]|nr:tetratricopeptide repeat protein [Pseudomonadota bacterium]MBU4295048.1 tetratricopeptide repeat protein [Pseudomonadota bacterium]MCG2746600.1 tetratricopeptide repeat protein [Desulfobulbaceae bacterium]
MNRKIDTITAYSLFFFIMALFAVVVSRFPVAFIWATYEDLLGEWSQFYFFAIALFFSVRLALAKSRFWLFFAALALACFYVTGEEISWGQRLFNIATPDFFGSHNLQQETNLHNFFTGPYNTLLKRIIEMLLASSFIIYGVIYPLELKVSWKPAVWINIKGLPAPPAYLWPFFVGAALFELRIFQFNEAEIAEILLSLALAIFSNHYWLKHKHQGKSAYHLSTRHAVAMILILVVGTGLAATTTSISYTVPRLKTEMDSRIDNGMVKFTERYGRYGSWRNAAVLYQLLLEKDQKNTATLRDLAACYQKMGQEGQFKEINTRAMVIDMTKYGRFPGNVATNLSLHKTFLQAGNRERAEFHLQKSLQASRVNVRLEPNNASAAYWLGKSYLAAGDTDAALRQLKKAVQLKPQSTSYKKTLYRLTLGQQYSDDIDGQETGG